MQKLPVYEWTIILLFSAILVVLSAFALLRSKPTPSDYVLPSIPPSTFIEVWVSGQVADPGLYKLPLKCTLKYLLELAIPLESADLSELNYRRKLHDGQKIHIPERVLITIYVSGAVEEEGAVQVLSGTRYNELGKQLKMLPDADLKTINQKTRFVKEGETILIPFKKAKKCCKKNF